MKKYFIFFFISLFILSCKPIAVRKYRVFRDISLAKVQAKKIMTIGIRDDLPPFTNRNKDSDFLEGFDIDMARLVCNEMKVMADFKVINWANKEELLKHGEIDCIWSAYPVSQGKVADLRLTKPYIRSCYVIGVQSSSHLDSIDDLDNKTLAIQTGSAAVKALDEMRRQKFKAIRDSYHRSFNFCVKELDSGNVDGIIEDILVINNLMEKEKKPYKCIDEVLSLESYCIAFRKNDVSLANRVQYILNELEYMDLTTPISKKWFGSNILIIGK
ncbi:MAG: transporter substrate-binding domain-containing protein [Treponema sp.]